MGRRAANDLDDLLERWARWCSEAFYGGVTGLSGGSLLGRLIDGHIGGGGFVETVSTSAFPLEERLEYAVVALSVNEALTADVLRMEYDANLSLVARRHDLANYDSRFAGQLQKAHALGVGVATYRRRLAKARAHIEATLAQ